MCKGLCEVIRLTGNDWQFYCPITGEKAFHDDGEPNAKSIRGIWVDAEPSEACYITHYLEDDWNKYREEQAAKDEDCDPAAFLKSVDKDGWIAFQITYSGYGCGPVTTTTWTALDLKSN